MLHYWIILLFWVGFLIDFPMLSSYSVISSAILVLLIIFQLLLLLATASDTILNNSEDSEHPHLVSDLSGKACGFSAFCKTVMGWKFHPSLQEGNLSWTHMLEPVPTTQPHWWHLQGCALQTRALRAHLTSPSNN